jgi:energy-coupling factor transporter ATP-binding protein EcfA2
LVSLIVGNRGSGKTKTLIDHAERAAKNSKGQVVCIERGESMRFGLSHKIRLIDIKEYSLSGAEAYYGFMAGLLAGNYDITEIFADATFRILCGKDAKDFEALAAFIEKLVALTEGGPSITLTVSCAPADLPERIRPLVTEQAASC